MAEKIKIHLPQKYAAALASMAKDSGLNRAQLVASLVKHVLDDDAAAHGGRHVR